MFLCLKYYSYSFKLVRFPFKIRLKVHIYLYFYTFENVYPIFLVFYIIQAFNYCNIRKVLAAYDIFFGIHCSYSFDIRKLTISSNINFLYINHLYWSLSVFWSKKFKLYMCSICISVFFAVFELLITAILEMFYSLVILFWWYSVFIKEYFYCAYTMLIQFT